MNTDLDELDLAILDIVQRNNLLPLREIAEEVNLSIAATSSRLRRLRRSNYICKNVSILSSRLLSMDLSVIVHVYLTEETKPVMDKVKEKFLACPNVLQCYCVTGECDFIIILVMHDMIEYERLIRSLFFDDGNVRKFSTFVVMDEIKSTTCLPLF